MDTPLGGQWTAIGIALALGGSAALTIGMIALTDEDPIGDVPAQPSATTTSPPPEVIEVSARVAVDAIAPTGFDFVGSQGAGDLRVGPGGEGLDLGGSVALETEVHTTDGACTFTSRSTGTVRGAIDPGTGVVSGVVAARTGSLTTTSGGDACRASDVADSPQPDQALSGALDLDSGFLTAEAVENGTTITLEASLAPDEVRALLGEEGAAAEAAVGSGGTMDTKSEGGAVALVIGGGLFSALGVGLAAAAWGRRDDDTREVGS